MAKTSKPAKTKLSPRTRAEDATAPALRRQLLQLLSGGNAHATFGDAVENFPQELRGVAPPGAPHTAWELLEHLRIAQTDILEFCRDPGYVSPEWPSGYWPESRSPADAAAWDGRVEMFRADIRAFEQLISESDLFARINHPEATSEMTLLREALLLAAPNAYHVGELVFLRRLLGAWTK
jgi:hypothetical protein